MIDTAKIGAEGEALAADHLLSKGYKILERNYEYKKSEIDLIVVKDDRLVFVEVKTRCTIKYGYPESFLTREQQKVIFRGALHYMRVNRWNAKVRYDIVAVVLSRSGNEILHIEDAFY